jgi:hypothetical protein
MDKEKVSETARRNSILHAGNLMPGFTKERDGLEFFVHAPVSSDEDISEDVERNECSLIMQAVYLVDSTETKVLLLSDANHLLLTDVVDRTERKKNEDRLRWDVVHIPHHSSYLSIGPEKGERMTEPVPAVERLYEKYGERRGWLVCSSLPIPETDEKQPPHAQAKRYYVKVMGQINGDFRVTMENPNKTKPAPLEIAIGRGGPVGVSVIGAGSASVLGHSAPRAGRAG